MFRNLKWTRFVIAGLFLASSDCLVVADAPAGLRADSAKHSLALADRYAQLLAELDDAIGMNYTELLTQAQALTKNFGPRFKELDDEALRINQPDDSVSRLGKRFVRNDHLLVLMAALGETSSRLTAALNATEFALCDERRKFAGARREAKDRNIREIQRASIEFELAVAARQRAMQELWALSTGRARVVATHSSGSLAGGVSRQATYQETLWYAANKHAEATAPIIVRPPTMTKTKEIHSIEGWAHLDKLKPGLVELGKLVDRELKQHLASAHAQRVKLAIETGTNGERVRAVLSLGWWNEEEGRRWIHQCLNSDGDEMHHAGLSALTRLRHDQASLAYLAHHKRSDVRIAAAHLAKEHIHNVSAAVRTSQALIEDPDAPVRTAGYEVLNHLIDLVDLPQPARVGCVKPALINRKCPAVVVDAISWLQKNRDHSVANEKRRLLEPFLRSPNSDIRNAASAAIVQFP